MKILIEKAVIEQALDYLENSHARFYEEREKAITALREVLAEQAEGVIVKTCPDGYGTITTEQAEQEPVGYWDGKFSKGGASALYEVPQESAFGYHYENYPLYAAPVRTKDLTDDELLNELKLLDASTARLPIGFKLFARAVIAADRERNR